MVSSSLIPSVLNPSFIIHKALDPISQTCLRVSHFIIPITKSLVINPFSLQANLVYAEYFVYVLGSLELCTSKQ